MEIKRKESKVRQRIEIEYYTDNKVQADKAVRLSTVPTMKYKPTK